MPFFTSYQDKVPVEMLQAEGQVENLQRPSQKDMRARDFVLAWRNRLREQRIEKVNVWNECWALYRGQEDFSNKEDWQSKIVLPKSWSTVKQAVNVIKRFLNTAEKPWLIEPTDPNNDIWQIRSEKMTRLSRVMLDKAKFVDEFSTGLETGFIMGLGVWKVGWGIRQRLRMSVQTSLQPNPQAMQAMQQAVQQPTAPAPSQEQNAANTTTPIQQTQGVRPPEGPQNTATPPEQSLLAQAPAGVPEQVLPPRGYPAAIGQPRMALAEQQAGLYPTQMPNEALLPPGSLESPQGQQALAQAGLLVPTKRTISEEILEGNLTVTAVDPYFFYWLPGSKLNRWTGTIEEIELPKWQLLEMAQEGAFDVESVKAIGPMQIAENWKQTFLRFGEMPRTAAGPTSDTGIVKLTEYFGPMVLDGRITEKYAHVIIANDVWVLKNGKNTNWDRKPPYCAFSPLQLPFRTDGVGAVEMVRQIDRALNQIINLGVDTLLFRLLPVFEFTPEVYENPEDFRTGLTPGKMFRRNRLAPPGEMGINPVKFEDVSPGASQVAGILDRAHQEGGLITELQQSLPRWSGAQTATETESIQQNQSSFFGGLATDIEQFAIAPIIEMAISRIMQYIDTANDPRVASVLGVDQQVLAGMSHAEVYEMIAGEYDVQVRGLSGQLEKAQMLQNLIQLMNIIGQNPQAWLPYLKQDVLLRRILESFRPAIHDIEQIVADPQTAQAAIQAQQQQAQQQQMLSMLPELGRLAHMVSQSEKDDKAKQVDQAMQLEKQRSDTSLAERQQMLDAIMNAHSIASTGGNQ